MKPEKFRELSELELINEIADLEEEQFNLRMNKVVSELDNPIRIRVVRRDIARAKTILNEHRLGIQGLQSGAVD
ncbi:MAG: 50S ribosomal protein L29 [Candidatus Cloacimonetes bacterium 4572_55]|nr:MAG: 50S ribosomal protein L29 [Candidatus Cloacimonetes bacterium 4572_55]